MKFLTVATLLTLPCISASAAFITYNDGITNVQNASGPSWVGATNMFREIIPNYGGAPDVSGATGATSSGFNLFEPGPGGGGLDITLLTWEFTTLDLLNPGDGDSLTVSPTATTPGFEDYRYDTAGETAPTNLTFKYNGAEWATGYITQFVVTVDNSADFDAVGTGTAVLTTNTVAGQDFMNEIDALTNGSFILDFVASSFNPVVAADPGTFGSAGQINIVPEPQTYALVAGAMMLGLAVLRRRQA